MSWFDDFPVCEQAIVNLKSGKAFRGVIWARRNGYLVLRNAELLRAEGERLPVDGEVVIDCKEIEFLQLPRAVT